MLKTTACKRQAAVIRAAGHQVTTIKKPCSPRCLFEYEDCPATRQLIIEFESRYILQIPLKSIFQAYSDLTGECKSLREGAL